MCGFRVVVDSDFKPKMGYSNYSIGLRVRGIDFFSL